MDLTVQGDFVYGLDDTNGWSIWQLPATGGDAVNVGWTFRQLTRIITDEAYHYSFYFDTDMTVGRSPLVTTPMGVGTFQALSEPKAFPSPVPGFEASDSHLYVVFSAATKELHRIPKSGGELTWIPGSDDLSLTSFSVDEDFVYDLRAKGVSRLAVGGGAVTAIVSAAAEETLSHLAITSAFVVVSSTTRVSTARKIGSTLQTLAELPNVYLLEADPHGTSVVFVQSLGDSRTCSDGSIVFESNVSGTPVPLSTLPPGCVSHLAFDDDGVYWSTVGGTEVFKVTRR